MNDAKRILSHLTEGATPTHTYTVSCRDGDGTLLALLEYIQRVGNTGHTFDIVVDPDAKGGKKFNWDGDGADSIVDIKEG